MSLTQTQIDMLSAHLDRSHVKQRQQAGRGLSYLESWHCIAEANRIFGFGGWDSEVIDLRLVSERERSGGKDGWVVSYVAKVRVTVFAGDRKIVREGIGSGHGIDRDLGQAHESAAKEGESDARKRALMTFGNPFGLALYDKSGASVSDSAGEAGPSPQRAAPPPLRSASEPDLVSVERRGVELSKVSRDEMIDALGDVYTRNGLDGWERAYSRQNPIWQRMTNVDREHVVKAYKLKRVAVSHGGALDTQRPLQ